MSSKQSAVLACAHNAAEASFWRSYHGLMGGSRGSAVDDARQHVNRSAQAVAGLLGLDCEVTVTMDGQRLSVHVRVGPDGDGQGVGAESWFDFGGEDE